MLGPSTVVPGQIGLFADAWSPPAPRAGLRSSVALAPVPLSQVVFPIDTYFLRYEGVEYSPPSLYTGPDNRYLFRSPRVLVDGSPRSSLPEVHYSAFVNEGFDDNNCCLDRHRRGAWYLSTLDIFHFHEILSAYGEEYWRLGPHSPALKAFAADYYARHPENFLAGQALLSGLDGDALHELLDGEAAALSAPLAFPAVVPDSPEWFYDNAASVSVCCDLSMLVNAIPLAHPFPLGGIGSGVLISHRGFLRFLLRHLALCYYSPRAGANLVSLGYLQKSGASYASVGTPQLRVSDVDDSVLDVGTMKDNRLTPVSVALVRASVSSPSVPGVAPVSSIVPRAYVVPFAESVPSCSHPDLVPFPDFLALHPGIGLCELYGLFAGASQQYALDLAFAAGVSPPLTYVAPVLSLCGPFASFYLGAASSV